LTVIWSHCALSSQRASSVWCILERKGTLQRRVITMAAPPPYPIHSTAEAAARIDQGEDPWFALGCFLHDWWRYAADHRQNLISEPPAPAATQEGRRRAAFCAAVVEELCSRTSFPCPVWTRQQDYVLERPWFYCSQLSRRDWLLSTTPESFKRRNIFIGGSVLDNKYELQHPFDAKPRWSTWSDQELQNPAGASEVSSTLS
jgi:hypothetical protein